MPRWWRKRTPKNQTISVSDPRLIEWFGLGAPNYAGVEVGEHSALGVSAVWQAVSLISGSIAGLPLRTLRDVDGTRTRVNSFLDDPGAHIGLTPFAWKEQILVHLLMHGEAFLAHVYNGAGTIAGLTPFHPGAVEVQWDDGVPGGKRFTANLTNGTRQDYDARTMTQIMSKSMDGLRGMSIISIARHSLGTSIAGERAAAKLFANGPLFAGYLSPKDEDVDEGEAKVIESSTNANAMGWENANSVPVFNRRLEFTPWSMSMADAQFLESRAFQIQEVARWFGVPANLLMDPGAVSTWGTGVEIQNRGLHRYTLTRWTTLVEESLSRLVASARFAEFDYAGFLKPTPEEEIRLLLEQVKAGVITVNEYRKIRNMDPIEGGDELKSAQPPAPAPAPAEDEQVTA